MKKSEFLEARRSHWAAQMPASDSRARVDVEAAEAAGVVWDPEEPELPERLKIFDDGSIAAVWSDGVESIVTQTCTGRKRTARQEAVRRYNLWPELLRKAGHARGVYGDRMAGELQQLVSLLLDGEP